jgi:hypothetical protein
LGAFSLPILQSWSGTSGTILIMAFLSLLGLIVTLAYKVETRGQFLEDLGQ